ncbi:MAG: lysylphosphatidylglycerol synthase transmembrane domain-containing protein [Gaiellaceae bacterium]
MKAWRRNLVRILIGSAATAAFLWLFLREVDLREAWREITALPGWTMVAALALVLANVLIMAVRWGYLLAGAGYQCGVKKLFSTVAVGRGANNILPARGGDLLRIESMRERNVPVFATAGTLFAERLLDGVVLSTWILFGAIAIGQGGPMLLTGVALAAGAALGVALVVVAARNPDGAERFAWRVSRRLPPRWHTRFTRAAAHFVDGLGAFRGRRRLVAIFGTSAAMWLADVAMYYVIGEHAFGLDLPVGAYFLLEGIGNLALAVPATAAGIGTFDYLTLLATKGVDIEPNKATAYVITMHALVVLPVTILGAVLVRPAFPRLRGRRREAAREPG